MKKLILTGLIPLVCLIAFLVTGCAKKEAAQPAPKTITIVDADGQKIEVKYPLRRLVVIGAAQMHAVCALGAGDQIVGLSEVKGIPDLEEKLSEKPSIGKWSAPSFEKILELKPDAIITYGRSVKGVNELKEKLEPAGIQVLSLDFCRVEYLTTGMRNLGLILGKEKKAEEFTNLFDKPLKLIKERTETLKPEQKVKVYWEQYKPNRIAGLGSQGDQMLTMAGGVNIATDEGLKEVSAEWVPNQNPQVIIRDAGCWGYAQTDSEALKKIREELMKRPGFNETQAVKNGNVYVITNDLCDPRAYVGVLYLAKWFYPQLFSDLDPQSIHKEVLEKFYGLEYKGAFVYP